MAATTASICAVADVSGNNPMCRIITVPSNLSETLPSVSTFLASLKEELNTTGRQSRLSKWKSKGSITFDQWYDEFSEAVKYTAKTHPPGVPIDIFQYPARGYLGSSDHSEDKTVIHTILQSPESQNTQFKSAVNLAVNTPSETAAGWHITMT